MEIFDNHLHLRRDGLFLEAVNDFIKAGGTHFILCQYPMTELVIKNKSYRACYEKTLKMADEIRKKTEAEVFVTVGPYPVDYLKLSEKFGRKKAINIMKKGMDEAAELCLEKKCVGIGEIGRPHFDVEKQVVIDSNEILFYGMKKAREVNAPVILHTESTTSENCEEFVEMGKKAGLRSDKIVKHFSPPLVLEKENHGLIPSVLASKKNIRKALGKNDRFLMETDYIDDLSRPGAVLGPKTVPRVTLSFYEKGLLSEENVYRIHKDLPEKIYDIEI